jgi:serine/threonine protein kinase
VRSSFPFSFLGANAVWERNEVQKCPTCGKELDPATRFCPEDGTPLTETAAANSVKTPAAPRASRRATLPLPTVVGNRYRLTEYRGGGGMAQVYRAVDATLEREVAVKLINPELRTEPEFDARFQREARIVSQLADPHIVVVHDFGIDPALGPYLVMEYLEGLTLRERLQAEGVLPFKAVVQLGAQLMLALIHAHNRGIAHRDIKPDNIFFLDQSGVRMHVRVLDFGIARIYRGDERGKSEPLTEPGAVLGTPRYMSPEQLAGEAVDARSDLYSAGMVLHEALTGHLPHVSGKSLAELCPDAPPTLVQLVEQCVNPKPNQRPESALNVYFSLQDLSKASGILLLPPGAMEKLLASQRAQSASVTPTVAYAASRGGARWWGALAMVALALAIALTVYGLMSLASP